MIKQKYNNFFFSSIILSVLMLNNNIDQTKSIDKFIENSIICCDKGFDEKSKKILDFYVVLTDGSDK